MTDVTINDRKVKLAFEDIDIGDMFKFKERILMKIIPVIIKNTEPGKDGNSITLDNGVVFNIRNNDTVTYLAKVCISFEYGPIIYKDDE